MAPSFVIFIYVAREMVKPFVQVDGSGEEPCLEVKPIKINNGREVTYWVLGA
jgi:hypothetical protein